MSLIVTLSPEVEALIRARVEREEDITAEVNSILQGAIEREEQEMIQAIDAGNAAFAAGRFSSGNAVWARFEAKYGVFSEKASILQPHVEDLERSA